MQVIALLIAGISAVKLQAKDIFDSYDEESALEQLKEEDQIDPAALTAEIGGDEIARQVMLATGGIQDQEMIQLDQQFIKFVPSEDVYMTFRPNKDQYGEGQGSFEFGGEKNDEVSDHW
jgi:hypothetical protein